MTLSCIALHRRHSCHSFRGTLPINSEMKLFLSTRSSSNRTPCCWIVATLFLILPFCLGWTSSSKTRVTLEGRTRGTVARQSSSVTLASSISPVSWFSNNMDKNKNADVNAQTKSLEKKKAQLLQLGAALDRGQSYNPTSGEYYKERMEAAEALIKDFCQEHKDKVPRSMEDIQGEWELVFSTVPHGIFRSSPFFLAVQEAFQYAEQKEAFGQDKAQLFFKLHELQTCSWGVSKIGRVAQHITSDYVYSEFDTSLFSLTVIPILGWFKLLPTFGGCVVTAAKAEMKDGGELSMVVDYTTARKIPGLNGLGRWIWDVKVPVGAIWKLLPWNKGRDASCKVFIPYCDGDFRIVRDISGDFFVYTRPVLPRALDLANNETK